MATITLAESQRRAEQALREINNDLPIARGYTPVPFDREQAFLLYTSFAGDVDRTAHALNVEVGQVVLAVKEGEWLTRLEGILKLRSSSRPGDVERAMNRATNFAQAHRMRMFLERLITKIHRMNDEELIAYCFVTESKTRKNKATGEEETTDERKISTRPFADLASAVEKIHQLTYLALGDSSGERKQRADREAETDNVPTLDIHAAISKAVSEAQGDSSTRAQLFDGQLTQVKNLVTENATVQAQKEAGDRTVL